MTRRDRAPLFGAVVTAMVTPFDSGGALDPDAAGTLARWLVDHGSDGLVVGGTTGEGSVLTDAERSDLWRAVREAVTVPLIAGAGTNDTSHSVDMARRAEDAGADAILAVTPYYNRPSQSGLRDHFRAVAGATSLPVVLYDIPMRTGRRIALETLLHLAGDVPNIVAVKDATGDPVQAATLVAHAPETFEIYCGEDALTLAMLAIGAVGVISVASHWVGVEMGEMVAAYLKGDVEGARHANARLIPSYEFESTEMCPNPLPAKAMCRVLGLPVGQCRLPMGEAPPELEGAARRILAHLGSGEAGGGVVG